MGPVWPPPVDPTSSGSVVGGGESASVSQQGMANVAPRWCHEGELVVMGVVCACWELGEMAFALKPHNSSSPCAGLV